MGRGFSLTFELAGVKECVEAVVDVGGRSHKEITGERGHVVPDGAERLGDGALVPSSSSSPHSLLLSGTDPAHDPAPSNSLLLGRIVLRNLLSP